MEELFFTKLPLSLIEQYLNKTCDKLVNMTFFRKINSFLLARYLDIGKIHNWYWTRSSDNYTKFKRLLKYSHVFLFILYFFSAYLSLFLLIFVVIGQVKFSFSKLLIILISLYIAWVMLLLIKRGFYKSYQFVLFNFQRIKKSNNTREINKAILDLGDEIKKDNKEKSKLISIFSIYLEYFVSAANIKENRQIIKNFLNKSLIIYKEKDEAEFLNEIIKINRKISKRKEYKYMQSYVEGVYGIKREKNIFAYLNKIEKHINEKQFFKRLINGIDISLEKIGQRLTVIIFIVILILLIFFPKTFEVFVQIFS